MDNTTFLLRFRTNTNQNDEHFRVDGINITGIVANTAPVAAPLALLVRDNTATSSTVTAVDSDIPAQTLTYSVVSGPSNGSLSGFDSSTGAFTYTPNKNYIGSDSFTFKANDGVVDSNTATVSITVNAYNERPVVTLIGPAYLLYTTGFPWVDPGATAMDEEDGDLTEGIVRTGELDMNTVGEYTLTYSVTDSGRYFPPYVEHILTLFHIECSGPNTILYFWAKKNRDGWLPWSSICLKSKKPFVRQDNGHILASWEKINRQNGGSNWNMNLCYTDIFLLNNRTEKSRNARHASLPLKHDNMIALSPQGYR
jgi:hypothetical protein